MLSCPMNKARSRRHTCDRQPDHSDPPCHKVKLPAPSHPPTFMDLAYLNKTWFLRGMHDGKHIYRFEHPTFGISKVLLPNVELTNTNTREGILFLPTADQLFMDGGDATVEEEQGREEGELWRDDQVAW
ncbi:unnamed protein product [Microthlaspi erraticum]|uniref:Arabidopsis retrotransposon Orf1 C-terminal domain-containing protein n=1 Tax=Microthlaspi erraticum TaxID=1685480 RepID=A0A6D2L5S9_9BRAS|nr:unnamed protein product [Microthlaspi erraticum]